MYDVSIIKRWIKDGEGSRLDFKTTISSRDKIAKNIVAFANSRGGKLVVGVEDKGFVVGVDFEGEKFELEKAAKDFCVPEIKLNFSKLNHLGKVVLIAEISESNRKPHFQINKKEKETLYVRLKDACVVAPNFISEMLVKGELNGLQRTYDYEIAKRRLIEYLKVNKNVTAAKWANIRSIDERNSLRFLTDILLEGEVDFKVIQNEISFTIA